MKIGRTHLYSYSDMYMLMHGCVYHIYIYISTYIHIYIIISLLLLLIIIIIVIIMIMIIMILLLLLLLLILILILIIVLIIEIITDGAALEAEAFGDVNVNPALTNVRSLDRMACRTAAN